MRVRHSLRLKATLAKMPPVIQKKFYKQVNFLKYNLLHPSLRAKKHDESSDTWQARVDKGIRFYFKIEQDVIVLLNIKKHPK